MSRPILADAFDHHVWATLRVIDACLALSDEQLATNVPGTYGSILDTMRHLVGADRGYLNLLSGGRVEPVDEEAGSLADLRSVIEANAPVWTEVLASVSDPDVSVTRVRDDGSTSTAPIGVRLAQVVHHGTDHRSQVCTALTTLGITPPEIDVWDFADAQGRLAQTEPTVVTAS
jgi:uncharacterized damage-inducible protein DinB